MLRLERTVVFLDLGGVLITPNTNPVSWITNTLLARGYSREAVDIVTEIAEADWNVMPSSVGWISTWAQEQEIFGNYYAKIAQSLPDSPADMAAELFWLCHDLHHAELYPDVLTGLEVLRACYRLAIVSNALPSADWIIDRLNIRHYFEHIILSAHVGCAKPDESIYNIALQAMECQPYECVFVDDKQVNVEVARKLGMHGFHLVRDEDKGDIHNFVELVQELKT